MIGRMSSMQLHQGSLDVILDAQARLQRTQEELASGKRILSPSDDPVAAAQISSLRSELSRIETFQRNIDLATSELASTETTIATAEDILNRARDLAVRASNASMNGTAKRGIAIEIDGLRDQLLALANTKNASGEYVFAGFASNAEAFSDETRNINDGDWVDIEIGLPVNNDFATQVTFEGDANARIINIAPGVTIATRVTGEAVFGQSAFDQDNDVLSAFEALGVLAKGIRGTLPTPPDTSPLANDVDAQSVIDAGLSGIDAALERLSDSRTDIGVRLNQLDDQQALNGNFALKLEESMSSLEDLDFTKAVTEMNLQMVALQAAQQAYTKTQSLSLFNYL